MLGGSSTFHGLQVLLLMTASRTRHLLSALLRSSFGSISDSSKRPTQTRCIARPPLCFTSSTPLPAYKGTGPSHAPSYGAGARIYPDMRSAGHINHGWSDIMNMQHSVLKVGSSLSSYPVPAEFSHPQIVSITPNNARKLMDGPRRQDWAAQIDF